MYVWGFNSTVTKHSDYFVWKDMSERVARRCDETFDKKLVNSCVLKHIFWRELSLVAIKKIAKKTWKCSLRRATNVTLSNFLRAVQKDLGVGSSYGTNKPPSGKPSFPYKCLILLFFSRQDE